MDRGNGPMQGGVFIDRAVHHDGPSALAWTIFAILLALLLIALITLALDAYYRSQGPRTGALAALDLRYARGEIRREAYLQARADLGGPAPSEAATEVAPPPRRGRRAAESSS